MKVELVTLLRGDLQLELIAETDLEAALLSRAWEFNGYQRGNGRTQTKDGSTGFYIPLCRLREPERESERGIERLRLRLAALQEERRRLLSLDEGAWARFSLDAQIAELRRQLAPFDREQTPGDTLK